MRTSKRHHRIKRTSHRRRSAGFRGFTLVEMLVAVALVLLMMSLFAQIFQLAGGSITTQRGIAENDQRSRSIQNIMKADLDKRTFRFVMPWSTGEDGSLPECEAVQRSGYFSYSENDPLNELDDELQFTVNVFARVKNPDTSGIFGKAEAGSPPSDPSSLGWVDRDSTSNELYLTFANQPEADDGWRTPNDTAEAPAAEIAYFVRGGKLYRRVLLIRKPLPLSGADSQPLFNDGRDAFDYTVSIPSGATHFPYPDPLLTQGISFWNDFDYSAFPTAGSNTSYSGYNVNTTVYARFHSVDDLSNANTLTQFPLGRPQYRFGHNPVTGRPREFDSSGVYFGRFTHEETSHQDFHYPHGWSLPGPTNPMAGALNIDTTTHVFPAFAGGPRRGEDLLLSNVHSFDVKIWDVNALNGSGAFVDIGRSVTPEDLNNPNAVDYALSNRLNTQFGPVNPSSPFAAPYNQNRVYDTWYPYAQYSGTPPAGEPKMDLNGDTFNDEAPFRPVTRLRGPGASQYPAWTASQAYNPGESVFPLNNQRGNGLRFSYRCVTAGTSSAMEPTVQEWPAVAGGRFTDGTVVWEAVDNWKPLRAIQITIRFHDVTSDQMRQQTIVHSLID